MLIVVNQPCFYILHKFLCNFKTCEGLKMMYLRFLNVLTLFFTVIDPNSGAY